MRFRLKKALPFDAEKAVISYQCRARCKGIKVSRAAVMLDAVLRRLRIAVPRS